MPMMPRRSSIVLPRVFTVVPRLRGFTLVELLVAMALLSVVGAAITATFLRHSRSSRAATARTELQDHLREGAAILAADLRSLSPSHGDFYAAGSGPRSLELNATLGTSAICAVSDDRNIVLPPSSSLALGPRVSFIQKRLDPGHGVFILDEGVTAEPEDDSWVARVVTSVGLAPGACGASPLVAAEDGGLTAFRIELDHPLPPSVAVGTPVRLVERVRYALYQSADSRWYLGYCAAASMSTSCASLQPISGPYAAANSDQSSGLSGLDFYYYSAAGTITTDLLSVARLEVALRDSTVEPGAVSGASGGTPWRDTLRVAIQFRNRQ